MRHVSPLLGIFLNLVLGAAACAPPPAVPAASPRVEPKFVPTTIAPTPTRAPATYDASVPAVLWGGPTRDHQLVPLDPSTGAALPGYEPISLGQSYFYAFSPDKGTVVALTFPTDRTYNGSLLLVDLSAWKTEAFDLKLDGWAREMAFSPDGSLLAISHGDDVRSTITLFDLKHRTLLAQQETDLQVPRIKFTSAGDALMLCGLLIKDYLAQNRMGGGSPQVVLLDAADLSERWRVKLEGVREGIFPKDGKSTLTPDQTMEPGQAVYLSPGLAFAPDRDALYVIHADSDKLTIVDFKDQSVKTLEIHARLSWLEQLLSLMAYSAQAKVAEGTTKDVAVSPDGKFLYVTGTDSSLYQDQQGNWQLKQTPLGLQVIRISDGSRLAHIETDASDLVLSPDGRFLYLRFWMGDEDAPGTEVFDTSKRQIVTRLAASYLAPTWSMDGEALLASTHSLSQELHHMTLFRPDDLSVLAEWKGPDYIAWLTVE